MCSRRFLQSFCTQQARCECATHAEVSFDVMKVTLGISAVYECDLWLFPHIFGAKLRRFRWKIARCCLRFGAILARTTCASTAKRAQSLFKVAACFVDQICTKFLNVRCIARENIRRYCRKIARVRVGFCRVFVCGRRAASAQRKLK